MVRHSNGHERRRTEISFGVEFHEWSWKAGLVLFLMLFVPGVLAWGASQSSQQKVLLSDVDTITVYADRNTAYRRTKPFPQLSCVGGDAQKYGYRVEAMQCKNMGASYGAEDIQWTCSAEIPDEFKLGRTEVVCEGYSSPDDPYVLKGSCAVEYTLHLTPKGRKVYLSRNYKNPFSEFPSFQIPKLSLWERLFGPATPPHPTPPEPSLWESFSESFFLFNIFRTIKSLLTTIITSILNNPFLLLISMYLNYRLIRYLLLTTYRFFVPTARRIQRRPFWSNFFGGGGGGNDPHDPPPPYTRHPPGSRKTYQVPPENQAWRPGFWSGLLGGAAAGYGLGSRNREQPPPRTTRTYVEPQPEPPRSWWSANMGWNRPGPQAPQGSGGVRGSGYGASTMGGAWTPQSGRDDWEGSSGGSGTYTSSGFGGTRRR